MTKMVLVGDINLMNVTEPRIPFSLVEGEFHAADIVLPLDDGSKRELRFRCVVRPDREQELLLQRLGLTLPERLRPPSGPEM